VEELTFRLENFEGPLDLLLALVSKHKMDLHNIPIMELIDQYTSVIGAVQEQKLDVASEFIEMAARLVEMKSYLLLPRSEEGERMKQELTGQLIEYDLCKRMAGVLAARGADVITAVRAPAEVEPDLTYTLRHDPQLLVDAWAALTGRAKRLAPPKPEQFDPLVTAPFVSVTSRVVYVLRGLTTGRVHRLQQLFSKNESRSGTVATFLAVLELVRNGRLQIGEDESLRIKRRSRAERRAAHAEHKEGRANEPETV
jgi:segregation and condensation protein A